VSVFAESSALSAVLGADDCNHKAARQVWTVFLHLEHAYQVPPYSYPASYMATTFSGGLIAWML
jgi:hypothetical protein